MAITIFSSVAPVYPVDDVEASVEWYQRVLGFEAVHVQRDPDGQAATNYAVLNRQAVWLHLILRGEAADGFNGRADAQFTVTDGLDELFDALQSQGVHVLQSPTEQPWGSRDFIVTDPDGNKVWISQPSAD